MPALVAGIHIFLSDGKKDVHGRNKSGHDALSALRPYLPEESLRIVVRSPSTAGTVVISSHHPAALLGVEQKWLRAATQHGYT
jgi:hypothetical protein